MTRTDGASGAGSRAGGVEVAYDITALSDTGGEVVAHLRDGFEDMLATWLRLAQAVLGGS